MPLIVVAQKGRDMDDLMFQWQDYLVFTLVLAMSAAIGFYYACHGGKQKTTKEYLLADKNMHWFPVASSLLASYISSQTLIGVPGEVYSYGTIYIYSLISMPIAILLASEVYLPIFKQLQVTSVFEYIEMRFGVVLRIGGLISYCLGTVMYISLVIYGPSLAFSAVTEMNLWLSIFSVSLVAIFYTVLGGMKAVLWTDTLQMIIMVVGLIALIIVGVVNEGGFGNIWDANLESGRLDFLVPEKIFDFDPRVRHTLWNQICLGLFVWTSGYATNQGSVQRALTLRSRFDFKVAYASIAFGLIFFTGLSILVGLIIYSHYKLCDPLTDGLIASKDQLYPLFVMKTFGSKPGLPGIMLASVFCASLSTISTGLCSMATIILQDVIKPLRPNISESRATMTTKFVSVGLGGVAITLVLLAKYLGTGILSMGLSIHGMTGGPSVGVFTLGILIPAANSIGAAVGFIVGSLWIMWLAMGALINKPYVYSYPTTIDGCNITDPVQLNNLSAPVYDPSTWNPHAHYRSGIDTLYDISYAWNGVSGFLVTMVIGIFVSLLVNSIKERRGHPIHKVKKSLLSPLLFRQCCFVPSSWREMVKDDTEDEEDNVDKLRFSSKRSIDEEDVGQDKTSFM